MTVKELHEVSWSKNVELRIYDRMHGILNEWIYVSETEPKYEKEPEKNLRTGKYIYREVINKSPWHMDKRLANMEVSHFTSLNNTLVVSCYYDYEDIKNEKDSGYIKGQISLEDL